MTRTVGVVPSERGRVAEILDLVRAVVVVVDRTGAVTMANRGACDLLGYAGRELVGEDWFDLAVPEDDRDAARAVHDHLMTTASSAAERSDGRVVTREGEHRLVAWQHAVVRDHDGSVVGVLSSGEDITDLRRARDVINRSPVMVFIWRAGDGWPIEYASANVADLLECSADELIGNRVEFANFVHPDDLGRVVAEVDGFAEHAAGTQLAHEPYRVVSHTGTARWVDGRTVVRYNDRGEITHYEGILLDISDRMATFERLRGSEERLARLARIIEDSTNEIYVFDATTLEFIEINREARRNLGYSKAELRSMTPLDLKTDFTSERFDELLEPMRRGETGELRFEATHRRKDGSRYPVEVHLQLLAGDDRPVFVAIILDTTERRKTEDELRWKGQAFEAGLTANSIADERGVINHVNDSFLHIWGYLSRADVVGRPIPDFLADDGEVDEIMRSLNETGRWSGEFTALRRDGTTFVASSNASVISDRTGRVIGYQSSVLDVSDHKRAERLLELRRGHLEDEIARRTADLRKAVDLMAGREVRMAELKEELAQRDDEIRRLTDRLRELGDGGRS